MEKQRGVRNLILSIVILSVAVTVAATSIYGWFTMNAKPSTGGIVNEVTGGLEVSLKINGIEYSGGSFTLDNAMPGDEYLFEFTAVPRHTISVNIVFRDIESVFEVSEGVYEDMSDALAIKYPYDASTYTRISQLSNGTAVAGVLLVAEQTNIVKFSLVFPTEPPEGKDINIYQDRTFIISQMVFLGVN
ncbi:MAG: hypothetical protein PHI19_04350 [Clostridia bacterium]|nr:hypothetical protein [Clostridia bacterium]